MTYLWQHEQWPHLTYDETALRSSSERVLVKAGELAGMQVGLTGESRFDTMITELSDETVHSFAIEGEKLNPRMMRDSLIASMANRDRLQASAPYRRVADVMLDARDTLRPMSLERLNSWHQQLFQQDRFLEDVGQLRSNPETMQVVSTRRGIVNQVHYEAPPSKSVPEQMSALLKWIEHTAPDGPDDHLHHTPGRAALVHLRFETIHPYSDGNGRIGRALTDFIAAQNPTFSRAPFSMSRVIQSDKEAYYSALQSAQSNPITLRDNKIDVTPFVDWFMQTMESAIDYSASWALHINHRNVFFDKFRGQLNERQEKALRDLFEREPERLSAGLSSRRYRRSTDASRQTASRDLSDLVKKGALLAPIGAGPSTSYPIPSLSSL